MSVSIVDVMSPAMRDDSLTASPQMDHSPAFNALIAQVMAVGGRGRVPRGNYQLNSIVSGNWSQVLEIDDGAVFTGPGFIWGVQQFINNAVSRIERVHGVANPATQTVGMMNDVTSTGSDPNYGTRFNFYQEGALTSGFSIGLGNIAVFREIKYGSAGMARWTVATSPQASTNGAWGVIVEEMNIMNRGVDTGWKQTRGESPRWAGGLQVVPESNDLAGGTGNICRNVLFAYAACHSAYPNDLGKHVKFYNGMLVEKDSIGPHGRGALFSGDTSNLPEDLPEHAIDIEHNWLSGINLSRAKFKSGWAIQLGKNQSISWGTRANILADSDTGRMDFAAAGPIFFGAAGSNVLGMIPVANGVNWMHMIANVTGHGPTMAAVGADTDIDFDFMPKGKGKVKVRGDLKLSVAGKGLGITEGTNAMQGLATLVNGTVTITHNAIRNHHRIYVTGQRRIGTPGAVHCDSRVELSSFTLKSTSQYDNSVVAYLIVDGS